MKKMITFCFLLGCCFLARGQGFAKAEYFFDTDPGVGNGITIPIGNVSDTAIFSSSISTTGLSVGFHFLGLRVQQNDLSWGIFETRGFFIAAGTANVTDIVAAEYFIDTDPGAGNGLPMNVGATGATVNFTVPIPTTGLSEGFHFLAIRTKDAGGSWGIFETRGFFISSSTANTVNVTAAEYFIDTDPGAGNGLPLNAGASGGTVNFTASIPTTSIAEGFHFLCIRTKDVDGNWGVFETRGFLISSPVSNVTNIAAAEYFIDSDPGVGNGLSLNAGASGGTVNFTASVPTASLAEGFHFLCIRTKDVEGSWGVFETRAFYLSSATANMGNIVAAEYFFDTDPGAGNGQTLAINSPAATVNQVFNVQIPPGFAPGSHLFVIRVKDADGNWGIFEKQAVTITGTNCAAADAGTVSANTPVTCAGTSIRLTTSGISTGVELTIRWQSRTGNGVFTDIPGTQNQLSIDHAPADTTEYRAYMVCINGNLSDTSNIISVAVVQPPQQPQWFADLDGDGFGDANHDTLACVLPPGYVTSNNDCDDNNSSVNPNSPEVCANAVDDNCNGQVNEGCCASAPAVPGLVTQSGSTTVCSGESRTFTISPVATAISYNWTPPAGAIVVSGQGSTSVTLIFDAGFTATAFLGVTATNLCGTSNTRFKTIVKGTTALPASITGPSGPFAAVCPGQSKVYSVPPVAGASSYTWSVPSGAVILNGQGTNSVNVQFNSPVTASSVISVTAESACGASIPRTKTLEPGSAPATPSGITMTSSSPVCPGSGRSFSVVPITTASNYTWVAPAGGTILFGQGNTSVFVNFDSAFDTSGTISVVASNGCGTSQPQTLTVVRGSGPTWTGAAQVLPNIPGDVCPGSTRVYTVPQASSASFYTWVAPPGASIVNGQGGTSVTVNFFSGFTANGVISVTASNACGTGQTKSANIFKGFTPAPGIIFQNGAEKICPGETRFYSISPVSSATGYTWNVPPGSSLVNGQGSTSVFVTYNAGFTSTGNIEVKAFSSCGLSAPRTKTVERGPVPGVPDPIVGQKTGLCIVAGVPYSTTNKGYTYIWSFIGGSTGNIVTGQGTSAITVNYFGFNTGTLSVRASNGCGVSNPKQLSNMKGILDKPSSITGPVEICPFAQNVSYSTPAIPNNMGYLWLAPQGATISDSTHSPTSNSLFTNSNSVKINFGNKPGLVKVAVQNACGTSGFTSLNVDTSCGSLRMAAQQAYITLFPNPAREKLNLGFYIEKEGKYSIVVFDALGKQAIRKEYNATAGNNLAELEVSHLAAGIYQLVVEDKFIRYKERFMIE